MKGIELYLISGFLGAGKTTFLQQMLENFKGKRIGVIVNEFGSIGIDGSLLDKEGIQLVELNNGSIFCSCIKGGFIKTLIDFTKEPIDVLLIENSGMADPSSMNLILQELSSKIERPYQYKGAVCIVDSVSFLKHVKVLAPVQNQIASSNVIIINKMDMVTQDILKQIEEKIRELNPQAITYQTMFSRVPFDKLQNQIANNGYIGETSNQPCTRPATYSIESEGIFTEQELLGLIDSIKNYVLRMKGLAKKEDGWYQVDVIDDYVKISDFRLGKRDILDKTKLVVIGKEYESFREELEVAFQTICNKEYSIFE